MNNPAILLIIQLTSRANIMRFSGIIKCVYPRFIRKGGQPRFERAPGLHVQPQLRCCRLIILKNKAKARKAHQLLWHTQTYFNSTHYFPQVIELRKKKVDFVYINITVRCFISSVESFEVIFLSSGQRANLPEFPLNRFKCLQHVLTDKTKNKEWERKKNPF